jgi:GT2 family glycosyltransferase
VAATDPAGVAQSAAAPLPAKAPVSVIVPCWGQLEYTRLCVPSLLRHSRPPYELVFVDLGSLDGTPDYLAGLAAGAPVPVQVVRAATALGTAAACRDALARARGELLVFLNNDVIVTAGWLEQLTALLALAPTIGLAGPVANEAPAAQRVEVVPYRIGPKRTAAPGDAAWADFLVEIDAVDAFARKWHEEHRGEWQEVERLGGFCVMVRREVLARVGGVQAGAGQGLLDVDHLGAQARAAGFTLACCRDLFVHHFGSQILLG